MAAENLITPCILIGVALLQVVATDNGGSLKLSLSPIKIIDGDESPDRVSVHALCSLKGIVWAYGGLQKWNLDKSGAVETHSSQALWGFDVHDLVWESISSSTADGWRTASVGDKVEVMYNNAYAPGRIDAVPEGDGSPGDTVTVRVNDRIQQVKEGTGGFLFYPPSIHGHAMVPYRHFLYVFGGDTGKCTNNLWSFDLESDQWSLFKGDRKPPPRSMHTMVLYEAALYVFGGMCGRSVERADLWRYDLVTSTWTEGKVKSSTQPGALWGQSAVIHKSKMYMYGGMRDGVLVDEFWVYDLRQKLWSMKERKLENVLIGIGDGFVIPKAPAPRPRKGHAAAVYKDSMIVVGGIGDQVFREIWMWNFETERWKQADIPSVFPALTSTATAIMDDTLYIHGGNNRTSLLDLFWKGILIES